MKVEQAVIIELFMRLQACEISLIPSSASTKDCEVVNDNTLVT
jgi:hypothetical protein